MAGMGGRGGAGRAALALLALLAAAGGAAAAGEAANTEDVDVIFGADMAAQLEALGAVGLDDLGTGDSPLGDDL